MLQRGCDKGAGKAGAAGGGADVEVLNAEAGFAAVGGIVGVAKGHAVGRDQAVDQGNGAEDGLAQGFGGRGDGALILGHKGVEHGQEGGDVGGGGRLIRGTGIKTPPCRGL